MPYETNNRSSGRTFTFDDPRLHMTVAGRLTVRIVSYIAYLVLIAAAFSFFISDILWVFWLGLLLGLFLLDRLVHMREGDRPISEMPQAGAIDLSRYLAPKAFTALEHAYDRSALLRTDFFLETAKQLFRVDAVREALRRLDVKPKEFQEKVDEFLSGESARSVKKAGESRSDAESLVVAAFDYSQRNKQRFIDASALFAALPAMQNEFMARLFALFNIAQADLELALIFGSIRRQMWGVRRLPQSLGGMMLTGERRLRHRIMNRAWTSRPTPTLDRYSYDFTDLAREEQIGFLIGHEQEYDRLVDALSRAANPNALLVGEAGVGKETIIAHLAYEMAKDRVPPALFDKRLVALQIGSLVAGAPPDELHKRIQAIVQEILVAGNVVLYVPEIHNLVHTSGTAYLSVADALIPVIMNDRFPVIGATYPREFKQLIEPRSDFAGAFEVIRVAEVSEFDAKKILVYESLILEKTSRALISLGAIKMAVTLAKKYFRDKFLPSSAEEILKEALVRAERGGEKFLGPDAIVAVAEEKVNVPIHEAKKAEAEALMRLEDTIHERLVDQDEAVKAVSDALRVYRSGLARPGGPIANFLFVGPTGVGKTELSKVLARVQFGSEKAMIRFDMTEYQDKQSFYRFIGSPDGAISGALTDAVRQKPYSVILLDEFEKAFPDILNLFLQVFDDGRLTDNFGRVVDFQNTVIIATSNAHSDIINEALRQGQTMTEIADYLKRKLTDVFKPELLNRFSKIIVFKNLAMADVEKIAQMNLRDISESVMAQGITLTFDATAVQQIAKLGYEPAFGARPLRRAIEEKVRAPLAEKILRKEVMRGSRTTVVFKDGAFAFVSAETGK